MWINNKLNMEKTNCTISNSFGSFRAKVIRHKYVESENTLTLILKINRITSESFEICTGQTYSKESLLSKIIIEEGNNNIVFNDFMCNEFHVEHISDFPSVEYDEVRVTFAGGYQAKKLYLSGPMSLCKDEATWKANFQKYEDIFTAKGYHVVNPAKNEILPTYEECLKHSLQQEMECDCVFFMPNSILSTGARLEYEIAKACGLEIVLIDDDISFTNNYANNSGIKCKNNKL